MLYAEFFSICSVGFHSVTQTRFMHFKEVDEKRRTDSFDVLGVPLLLLIILSSWSLRQSSSHILQVSNRPPSHHQGNLGSAFRLACAQNRCRPICFWSTENNRPNSTTRLKQLRSKFLRQQQLSFWDNNFPGTCVSHAQRPMHRSTLHVAPKHAVKKQSVVARMRPVLFYEEI